MSAKLFTASGAVHNIVSYGATGGANDTVAFQNAIDAAARTQGSVFIPRGTWNVATLRYKSNMRIYGVDHTSIVKLIAATNTNVFLPDNVADGQDNVVFENFRINGNRDNQTTDVGTPRHGIACYHCHNITIRNMRIGECEKDCIYLGVAAFGTIVSGPCDGITVQSNILEEGTRYAMGITSAKNVLYEYNTCLEMDDMGIDMEPNSTSIDYIEDIIIRNNVFYNHGNNPYAGAGTGQAVTCSATGASFKNIQIVGNYIYIDRAEGGRGINILNDATQYVDIVGNYIGGVINNGILASGACGYISIIGNVLTTTHDLTDYVQGIRVQNNVHDITVQGNYLTNYGYAISGIANTPYTLTNLDFSHNDADGAIYFDGTGTQTNCTESDNVTDLTPPPTTNKTGAVASEYSDNIYAFILNWEGLTAEGVSLSGLGISNHAWVHCYNALNHGEDDGFVYNEYSTTQPISMAAANWSLPLPEGYTSDPAWYTEQFPDFGTFVLLEDTGANDYPTVINRAQSTTNLSHSLRVQYPEEYA